MVVLDKTNIGDVNMKLVGVKETKDGKLHLSFKPMKIEGIGTTDFTVSSFKKILTHIYHLQPNDKKAVTVIRLHIGRGKYLAYIIEVSEEDLNAVVFENPLNRTRKEN
ncbi:hypothetical protein TNCV_3102831 [Trichonephila clavipes]|nr:hypothetical protein TNCV_3102831 [Trichonephila clavipes]